MRRRSLAAALSGVLLFLGAGPAAASPAELEWAVTPGANPGTVALPAPSPAGRAEAAVTVLADLDTSFFAGYAVPDSGLGAAAVTAARRRFTRAGADEVIQYYGYTWGRAFTPKLAAGATLRWEERWWEFADGTSSPKESGPGLDLGAVVRLNERTWAEAAVRDAFDTSLKVAGVEVNYLPARLELGLGRKLTPALSVGVKGFDLLEAGEGGFPWEVAARLDRGGFAWQAGLTGGTDLGVWAGLLADRNGFRVNARFENVGGHSGATAGVTVLW